MYPEWESVQWERGSAALSQPAVRPRLSTRLCAQALLISLRPHQWIKNILVFGGLIFSGSLLTSQRVIVSVQAFLCFCLASSSVYLFNDLIDRIADRHHPAKRFRPIASGAISSCFAASACVLLASGALLGAFSLNFSFSIVLALFLSQSVFYSLWLKHVVFLDVTIIAFGFVLRSIGGAVVIDVPPSSSLVFCTLMLALLVGFGKRFGEISLLREGAHHHRRNLGNYSADALAQTMSLTGSAAVLAYSIYTQLPQTLHHLGTRCLGLTVPLVWYAVHRYQLLARRGNQGSDPAWLFLTDRPLLLSGVIWVLTVVFILYAVPLI